METKCLHRQDAPREWNWISKFLWTGYTWYPNCILNAFDLVFFRSLLEIVIDCEMHCGMYISKLKSSFSLSSHFSQGRSIWLWRNCLELLYQRNSLQLHVPIQREWRSCRLTPLPESNPVCSCLFPLTSQQQYNNH